MASNVKNKVRTALQEVKREDDEFEFDIFESGDFLLDLQTTVTKDAGTPDRPSDDPTQGTSGNAGGDDPKLPPEDDDGGGSGQGGDTDGDGGDGKGKGKGKDQGKAQLIFRVVVYG